MQARGGVGVDVRPPEKDFNRAEKAFTTQSELMRPFRRRGERLEIKIN